jgi:DNA modification methylase
MVERMTDEEEARWQAGVKMMREEQGEGKMTPKIETRLVAELIPYAANSRTHSDAQVAQIAASIKEFGWTNPILIDGENTIIAGHGRLLAARKLGMEEVPAIILDHLTKAQQRALVIADNQLALNAGWDMDMLKAEIEGLNLENFDLGLLGFDDKFLDGLLEPEPTQGLTDEDAVPEVPETPKTVLGDVWVLGNHRLMCGDSTSIDAVDKLMDGAKPDLIHTDPPYGMNAVSKSSVLKKNYKTDIMGDDTPDVAKDAFNLIYDLYPDSKQIWWGANYYCSALPDSECWLVWDKNNGSSDQTDCELAWANFRSVVRQFTMASEKKNRVHPTQKPVALMEWIIKRFNLSASTIADFFGGSGSTLIAAEKHGINAYIMEFDPKYCDVIIKRWQDFTGQKAIHAETGEAFDG